MIYALLLHFFKCKIYAFLRNFQNTILGLTTFRQHLDTMTGTFSKVQSVAAFPTCKWMGVETGLGGSHRLSHRYYLNSSQYTEHSPHPGNPPASELSELHHLVSGLTMRLSKISVTINPQFKEESCKILVLNKKNPECRRH